VDCLTCHLPHPDGAEQASGRRLRLPNLRRELCLACHCQQADAPRIEIISPLERAVVRDDHVALIGRASHLPEDLLTVRINGSAFSVHAKNGNFFTRLTLREGTNRIAVEQAGRALWEGEVFQGRDSSDHYGRTSSGHGTANREECLGCHVTQDGVGAGVSGGAPTHCYGCHDRIEGKRYVHGPLAVGDCLACHDPHGGFGDAHLRREAGPLCRGCHPAGEHGPATACATAGKGCVECHDPHQSDARYLLRGPRYTMRAPFPDPPPVPEAPPAR
jgi:predicted CXXCH cytochrome family protein